MTENLKCPKCKKNCGRCRVEAADGAEYYDKYTFECGNCGFTTDQTIKAGSPFYGSDSRSACPYCGTSHGSAPESLDEIIKGGKAITSTRVSADKVGESIGMASIIYSKLVRRAPFAITAILIENAAKEIEGFIRMESAKGHSDEPFSIYFASERGGNIKVNFCGIVEDSFGRDTLSDYIRPIEVDYIDEVGKPVPEPEIAILMERIALRLYQVHCF